VLLPPGLIHIHRLPVKGGEVNHRIVQATCAYTAMPSSDKGAGTCSQDGLCLVQLHLL
jgi:hypothetical protein